MSKSLGNPVKALTVPLCIALDYLSVVDDFSRMGALRLQHNSGTFLQTVEEGDHLQNLGFL